MKRVKKILMSITATILTVAMVSCSSSGSNKNGGSKSGDIEVVNIGTQQMPNDEGIAKANKYFEEEMGVEINLVEFDSGRDVNTALLSGSIDFGLLGSSPATLGIASGTDVELIWIHEVLGTVESLAVKNDSSINDIKDIVGKKIAVPFASTAHYSLLNALKLNNIAETDLTLLDMQPADIYAAWQRGDIDGAYVWEPTLSSLLEDGKILLSSEDMADQGVITANVEVVRKEFAEAHPDLVVKYIKALNKGVNLYKDNKDEAITTVSEALNITEEDAKGQMEGSIWLSVEEQLSSEYFGTSESKGDLVESVIDTAKFLYDQKSIDSLPDNSVFEDAVNPYYIEEATK